MTIILSSDLGGQALHSCSPLAILQSASVSCKESLPVGTLVAAATQKHPLITGSGSHRAVAIGKKVLGRWPSPGHYAGSRLRHLHSPSVKRDSLLFCPVALAKEAHFRYGKHIVDYGTVLKECRLGIPSCAPSLPCFSSLYLPEKSLYTHVEPPFLQLPPRKHCQIAQQVRFTLVVQQDCIYLHTLKSCYLWVWIPQKLNLGA